MVYQASPYQMQPPSFASPLDQIVNGVQSSPSTSRGALLDRAFSLTRGGPSTSRARGDGGGKLTRQAHISGHSATQARQHPHEHRAFAPAAGQDTLANAHAYAQQQQQQHEQNYDRSFLREPGVEHQQSTDRERVQRLRQVRLSQQGTTPADSGPSARSPAQHSSALVSNAFRDSVASDISFNSITGTQERSSMLSPGQLVNRSSPRVDENGGAWNGNDLDADRIAQEVRGLAMRRRPSLDTVRSSEFGEGGRWAKAWAGSDGDDDDDDEEDEMDLQAMRASDLNDLDVEGKSIPQQRDVVGLGALGELGSLQGARAAMRSLDPIEDPTSSLPPLREALGSAHKVSLVPSSRLASRTSPHLHATNSSTPSLKARPADDVTSRSPLSRRDTITSMAGDVGEAFSYEANVQHARNDSTSTLSSTDSALRNDHVKVWPPTPASSVAQRINGSRPTQPDESRNSNRDTLRATPKLDLTNGQNAVIEQTLTKPPEHTDHPLSPSSFLASATAYSNEEEMGSTSRTEHASAPVQSHRSPYQQYANPDEHMYAYEHDGLGKMRRKAIADHGGRESLVSDLDVMTLRLDGSSIAGSKDDWDSRRGSTSTIGTVSSLQLDEQRRRRSQLEQRDAVAAGYEGAGKRSSVATIRGDQQTSSQLQPHSDMDPDMRRNNSHASPLYRQQGQFVPSAPKRSNTLPEDQNMTGGAAAARPPPWASQHGPRMQNSPLASPNTMQSALHSPKPFTSPLSPSATSAFSSPAHSRSGGTSATPQIKRTSGGPSSAANQSQAEKFLTLGISHHESGDLSRSAFYFERSAKVEGGCVVGMCMWGMALREGWGVRKDQKRGFEWISRAASRAGEMMSGSGLKGTRTEAEVKASRSELKLSVYELGKCFCYGWGVKMDKQMALEYFELAAKLGDSDAQAEAGALLAAGKGCKKDLKKAAMYYRMAEAQGYDTVGLSWIHKDKYNPTPVPGK